MAIPLEELQRQREQIQKHLEWLDAKIRELAPESEQTQTESPPKVIAPVESVKAEPEEERSEIDSSEEAKRIPEVEVNGQVYKAKTADELMRAKVGCLVLFVLSCLLFLFLLFGLPYLL